MANSIAVIFVPFPAQSHLNQLLHLSLLLLSSHSAPTGAAISVHYIAPAAQLRQVQSRLHGHHQNSTQSIQFHELQLPPHSNLPPNPVAKFPAHLQPLFDAFVLTSDSFGAILRSLSAQHSRLVVIHDPLSSLAAVEAEKIPNSEAFTYMCSSAVFQLVYSRAGAGESEEFFRSHGVGIRVPSCDGILTEEFDALAKRYWRLKSGISAGVIMNTCRALEGEFIDLVAQEAHHVNDKLFAIAPLTSMAFNNDHSETRHECLEWLDEQPPASVLYVSFGTTTTLDKEEIEALAVALQRSGQRFMWVLRDADRCDIFANDQRENISNSLLPPDFKQNVKDRGLVITSWAPQLTILAHRATGAFMSHCGWNSCMESLSNGVPIIAWPMNSDQPINATLVAEYHKAGVILKEWGRQEECVSAEEIEEAIKRVMAYDEGKEIRKRAKSLGDAIQGEASEGGASHADLNAFIAYIMRERIVDAEQNGSKLGD